MKATIDYVKRKFQEFNHEMFGGRLPEVPVELCDSKSYLGQLCCRHHEHPGGKLRYTDFRLRISIRFDLEESVLDDVIIHEMIHYFIFVNQLIDTAPHGHIFKAVMDSINANHGRKISVSHHTYPTASSTTPKYTQKKWRTIATIHTIDGKVYIKILPSKADRIKEFYDKISRVHEVKSVELFMHNNPFFGRYPSSVALRLYPIEPEVLKQHLEGGRRLAFEHGTIVIK